MSIAINDCSVRISGQLTVEEAEALMEALRTAPAAQLDLSECTGMHAAALQVILALAPRVSALPVDRWMCGVLLPLLDEVAP